MNSQNQTGNWNQLKGLIKKQWGELSDDELEKARGNIDMIKGKIQNKYGDTVDDINKKLGSILDEVNDSL